MATMYTCNYCRSPAELVCVRCRDRYCSRKCQEIDWPQHKLFCFPMPETEETTFIKSEGIEVLRPPSPSSKCRNLKLATDITPKATQEPLRGSVDNIPKPDDSVKPNDTLGANDQSKTGEQTLPGKEENVPKSNGSVRENGISQNNVPPVETKGSAKPAYYKTDKVDVATMRKPGTLSQVMPNKVQSSSTQPIKQAFLEPKQDKVEPPKQQKVDPRKEQKIEPSKQPKIEPPKQQTVTQPQPQTVEPTKQPKVDPPKQPKVEPPKQQMVMPPKPQTVEPPKQPKVEPPKQPKVEPHKQQTVEPPKPQKVEPAKKADPATLQSPKSGPWMKPFPMEDNVFVEVTIQYVAPDGTSWVSLVKKEDENTTLLRKVNKIVSVAATPDPKDIYVNSLFLVPFEDIYYRGVVLKPVSSDNTVLVRLVDFGNEFNLPIGQLKIALPSVSDLNAYAFPIKFKKPRDASIGIYLKVKKVSSEHDVVTVIVDGEDDVTPKMITMNDIDVVPLPVGAKQKVVCKDFSHLASGYISLCIADAKPIEFIEAMGLKISKYCEKSKEEYRPQSNEICLAKYEDEGWFRALTLKVLETNKFEIMFIDFGNESVVHSSAIRKMTEEFTHPCLMNRCYIKDFPKAPTKDDIMKAALYFDANEIFCADLIEKDGDKYWVSVKF